MPFTDWHLGAPTPHVQQEYSFVMSTTVADLSYTPSEEEKSRDAAQFVATGRKSWKTLKGKGEAVWPPHLEAALLEALEKYRPEATGAKAEKVMGRFPMRNRFISDYIFESTGKRRTPKQVGSRLQQLRDTCKKEHILQLISHRNTPEPSSAGSQTDSSHGASPSPRIESRQQTPSHNYVYVKISLPTELWPAVLPSIHLIRNTPSHPQIIQLSPSSYTPSGLVSHKSASPNNLPYLSKSMEFRSQCALATDSSFNVYYNSAGSRRLIHTEAVPLTCISSPVDRSGWLYHSELVSEYWGTLCSSQDLSQYDIVQVVRPVNSGIIGRSNSFDSNSPSQGISIVYKFDPSSASGSRRSSLSTSSLYSETTPLVSQMNTVMPTDYSQSLSTTSPSAWQIPDTDDQLSNECLLPLSGRYRPQSSNLALTNAAMGLPYTQYQNSQDAYYDPIPKANLSMHDASVLYAPVPMSYQPLQLQMYYS